MKKLTSQQEHACASVMRRIERRRLNRSRFRAGLYGFFLIAAVAALVPSFEYIASSATASGFANYISLIASNGSDLAGSWGALALSLIESAPLAGIMCALLALTAGVYCARKFAINNAINKQFLSHITA